MFNKSNRHISIGLIILIALAVSFIFFYIVNIKKISSKRESEKTIDDKHELAWSYIIIILLIISIMYLFYYSRYWLYNETDRL